MNQPQFQKPKFFWLKLSLLMFLMFIISGLAALGLVYFGFKYLIRNAEQQQIKPTIINFEPASNAPAIGSGSAPVTIIEFADFQCPFCKAFHDLVFDRLKTDYIDTGKVRFVFQDFAFLGPESVGAAAAAKCSSDQGKFWEYFDALYDAQTGENSGDFSETKLLALSATLGLDQTKFAACVTSKAGEAQVLSETGRAQAAGITSTPTLLIDGQVLEGIAPALADQYYRDLSSIIDQAIRNSIPH